MNVANKTILITGANRGIGEALVEEATKRGAQRVHAGSRGPLQHPDKRVLPVMLDVTSLSQIHGVASEIDVLDVLINNSGIAMYDDLSEPEIIEQHLAVNLFGPLNVIRAFLPLLKQSKGAIVNHISMSAVAALPIIPGYSISKAALRSMSQSLRALLASQGVTVHAILTGPVDTDIREVSISRRHHPSPSRPQSSTVSIRAKKRSFRMPCLNPSPKPGTREWPRPWNAKTRLSSPSWWLSRTERGH